MISKMRSWAPTIMVIILVSFVIGTIFFNWGMNRGSSQGTHTNIVGKINGREIPLNYFDREVNAERQKLDRGSASDDQYQSHQIPRQVWEQQVTQVLMKDFFSKVNLYASADEVFDYIKRNPPPGIDTASALMTNGIFDTAKYVTILNDPRTYEYNPGFRVMEQQTRELIIPVQKLEMLLSAPLLPTKAEMEYFYKTENEKAVFEYAYIKNNAVKIDSSRITDDMVAKYYTAHRDTFACEDLVDLYVVTIPKKPTAHDEQVYYQELLDIKNKIQSEKDVSRSEAFSEEAKVSSDDEGTAQNGGDLGFFKRGAMVPEFDSVAFKLDAGTISNPIKTRFGYHLIFVEKRQKHVKTEEVKARHILRKIVPTIETSDALTEKADTLRRKMLDGTFVTAAREAVQHDVSIVFDSTGLFTRNSLIPGIGYISGFGRFIAGLEGKESETVSERLENSKGFYLLSVKQRIPKGIMPLEAAKPQIRRLLADSLHKQALRLFAEEWSRKIGEITPLFSLKKFDSATVVSGVTDTVTRMSPIPGVGVDSKAAAIAFALPAGKRSGLIECNGTFFLVRTLWKGPPVFVPWGASQIAMMASRIIGQLRERLYTDWYTEYKNRQKIICNIDKIYVD
jgi:hypothetical protein